MTMPADPPAAANGAANPLVVEVTRGDMVESRHRAAAAILDRTGKVVDSVQIGSGTDGAGILNSHDLSIPRFTWWDHRGTAEWVQCDFGKAKTISKSEVFWFDDSGKGSCRVPASWRLLYQDGESWRPAEAPSEFGTSVDRYNVVSFKPVRTTGLRLEVQLQPGFSGGILEWKVN